MNGRCEHFACEISSAGTLWRQKCHSLEDRPPLPRWPRKWLVRRRTVMSRNVRAIVFALLLVLVSASTAQALPLDEGPGTGLANRMLSWIGTLLSPDFASAWETAGSQMDLNGEPRNNNLSAPNSEEEGSSMDPNG